MMMRLNPQSPADAERAAELQRLIEASAAAYAKLPPVDKALAVVHQMQSYVRGDLAIDGCAVPHFDDAASILAEEVHRLRRLIGPAATAPCAFNFGDRVFKHSGAEWSGRICGVYSTDLTPIGYGVVSVAHRNSVQVYPQKALAFSTGTEIPRLNERKP